MSQAIISIGVGADWYTRRVGVAAARQIKKMSAGSPSTREPIFRPAEYKRQSGIPRIIMVTLLTPGQVKRNIESDANACDAGHLERRRSRRWTLAQRQSSTNDHQVCLHPGSVARRENYCRIGHYDTPVVAVRTTGEILRPIRRCLPRMLPSAVTLRLGRGRVLRLDRRIENAPDKP